MHSLTHVLKETLLSLPSTPYTIVNNNFFDTLTISTTAPGAAQALHEVADQAKINLRRIDDSTVGVTLDESVGIIDLLALTNVFVKAAGADAIGAEQLVKLASGAGLKSAGLGEISFLPDEFKRTSKYLTQPVFNTHHSETEMLRYIYHLQSKDLSLVHAMIPLGSCQSTVYFSAHALQLE